MMKYDKWNRNSRVFENLKKSWWWSSDARWG